MSNLQFKKGYSTPSFQHASLEEYAAFVQTYTASQPYSNPKDTRSQFLLWHRQFVQCYPVLENWFSAPLPERIGRISGDISNHPSFPASYRARHYLTFLALHGHIALDWDWLIATHNLTLEPFLSLLSGSLTFKAVVEKAVSLGYDWKDAHATLQWPLYRILLHIPSPRIEDIRTVHLVEFEEAVEGFAVRNNVTQFFGSPVRYRQGIKPDHITSIRLLQTVLYHLGQVDAEPQRVKICTPPRLSVKPQMEAVVTRYIQFRSLTDQPGTIKSIKRALLKFIDWIAQTHPQVEAWIEINREHLMEYAVALNTLNCTRGRPFAISTKYATLSCLSVFFQDTIAWEWEDVPKRPPLQHGDLPRLPLNLPRYIPQDELDRLMPAIRDLECLYQRAALLIARWSGARRDEIQRLAVDCLDSFPNGTSRLRIPAGKTKKERLVPLNEEAAAAIRLLQAQREGERGMRDRLTGLETRYLFVRHGKLISTRYLFEDSLKKTCTIAGLVTLDHKSLVTAHRFRHTVGTQLAQGGARLRTIQKILGHESAEMSLVYIGLTDEDVKQDYQKVLGVNALIAGPGAEKIHSGEFTEAELNWLKTNFFKTELELGHCLRLPQEGPCQCDLYLNCAKFVTSSEYVPRLRQRRTLELELMQDAHARGWMREVERHHCTLKRLDQLLTELGEPTEEPEKTE